MCRDTLNLVAAAAELFQFWRRSGRPRVRIRAAVAFNLTSALGELMQGRVLFLGRDAHRQQRKAWSHS